MHKTLPFVLLALLATVYMTIPGLFYTEEIKVEPGFYAVYRVEVVGAVDIEERGINFSGAGYLSWKVLEIRDKVALVEVSSTIRGWRTDLGLCESDR